MSEQNFRFYQPLIVNHDTLLEYACDPLFSSMLMLRSSSLPLIIDEEKRKKLFFLFLL